jgi:DNA polymerase III polC-type
MMGDNDAKKKGEILEKGIKIVDSGNTEIKVNYLISDKGGQGDVYHVSYKGKDYALKWYCKHPDDVIGGAQHTTITKGLTQEMTEQMKAAGIPDWYIESCNKIQYVYPWAQCLEYAIINWRLAYYWLHYPEVYRKAYEKHFTD